MCPTGQNIETWGHAHVQHENIRPAGETPFGSMWDQLQNNSDGIPADDCLERGFLQGCPGDV